MSFALVPRGQDSNRISGPTVVLVNWLDPERTFKCLQAIANSTGIGHAFVVDNESAGPLRLPQNGPEVTVIRNLENRGFAAAVNAGLSASLAAFPDAPILVINNDAHFTDREFVAKLIDRLASVAVPAVVAPVTETSGGELELTSGALNRRTFRIVPTDGDPDYLSWACVLVHPEVLRRHGLLDERFFMYWEDVEFGLRLKRAAVPLVVANEAKLVHEVSASHGRAGAKIDLYSALGVVILARAAGPRFWVGGALRIAARVWARLARRDYREAVAVVHGASIGIRLKPGQAAWEVLHNKQILATSLADSVVPVGRTAFPD